LNDYNYILVFFWLFLPKVPDIKLDCEVTKKLRRRKCASATLEMDLGTAIDVM